MDTTANYAFPYPEDTDSPSGHLQIQLLAEAVDTDLFSVDGRVTNLEASIAVTNGDSSVTNGTTTSTTFTNALTTSGARGVVFTAPSSGKVLITVSAGGSNSTAGQSTYLDMEVRTGAVGGGGSIVRNADDNTSSQFTSGSANAAGQHTSTALVTGLTPGSSYNVLLMYRVSANTGTYNRRKVTVIPTR